VGPPPTDPGERDPPSGSSRRELVAVVSGPADGERTCTISPVPGSERALQSAWILARGESFVPLPECR